MHHGPRYFLVPKTNIVEVKSVDSRPLWFKPKLSSDTYFILYLRIPDNFYGFYRQLNDLCGEKENKMVIHSFDS